MRTILANTLVRVSELQLLQYPLLSKQQSLTRVHPNVRFRSIAAILAISLLGCYDLGPAARSAEMLGVIIAWISLMKFVRE